MIKPIFKPEINWGHILTFIGFIGPALVFGIGFASDFRLLQVTVSQHDRILQKVVDTQNLEVQTQAVMNQQIQDLLWWQNQRDADKKHYPAIKPAKP